MDHAALEVFAADVLRRARAHLPAVVTAYNPATGRARATLGLVGQTAAGQVDTPIPLVDAPVVWPRFGGFSLVGPLNPGDPCLACIADRAIDRWLLAGGVVPLESDRMHDLSDAVLLPGLVPLTLPPPALGAAGLYLGADSGSAYLSMVGPQATLEAASIRLGATAAAQHVALAELLHVYLVALFTTGVPVPLDGGAALKAAWLAYLAANPPASFSATKVTAE